MTEKVNLGERFFWHFWHFWHFWQELRKDLILLKGFSPSSPSTWKFYTFQICSSFVRNTHTHRQNTIDTVLCESHLFCGIFSDPSSHVAAFLPTAIAHSSRVFSILSKVDRSSFHFSSVHNSKFLSAVWKLFSLQCFSATAAYTCSVPAFIRAVNWICVRLTMWGSRTFPVKK